VLPRRHSSKRNADDDNDDYDSNNNNSIQFFIIYVPSQQPQGQLQAQHSVDTDTLWTNTT
jgi:hypothetical protein